VTGSVHAGVACIGETMTLAPSGHAARLRGLRVHDRDVRSVASGDRCAAHLSGIALDDIRRGDWIIAGANRAGQKFILRDQSALRTLGGGRVLDPLPPARQNQAARLTRLGALCAPDAATAFARLLAASPRGFDFDTFAQSWNLTAPECDALFAAHPVKICHDGDARIAISADHWKALCDQIVEVLGAHHAAHPDLLGLNDQKLHAAVRPAVTTSMLRRAIAELRDGGVVLRRGTIVHLLGHRVQPTPAELALWKRVAPMLERGGVRPPRVRELVEQTGIALDALESFLDRAEQLEWVHQVASNRFFLPPTLDELERMAQALAAECPDGTFAAADFNRVSGIGRNLTIQVLEYLDRIGITQRHGDRRRLTREFASAGEP
jgi:selenocysteine-specific elongation factor